MSGNMPNNYFPYDRRFSNNQDSQNRRFPDGQPNTYNRNQFRPFGRPQDCFQPSFNPGWGGNNNCNPCTLKELEYKKEVEKTALDYQNQADKRATTSKWVTIGATLFGALILAKPLFRLISNTVGTPALKDNSGSGTSGGTTTTTGGSTITTTKDPAYFEERDKALKAELDTEIKAAGDNAEQAKKAKEDYDKKKAALEKLKK